MEIYKATDVCDIDQIVKIHLAAFSGFFLTFLGKGFLKYLYKGFIYHSNSGILVAKEGSRIAGFLAYSTNLSEFYSYLLKRYLVPFAWYGFLGALRSPKSLLRIIRALKYPSKKRTDEKYIEISSIAVDPEIQTQGVGSGLIQHLCEIFADSTYKIVRLETDAYKNEIVNTFYQKNGFSIDSISQSPEGRRMSHYVKSLN